MGRGSPNYLPREAGTARVIFRAEKTVIHRSL